MRIETGSKFFKNEEQQSSLPQGPNPPISRATSRTPIWRISILLLSL